MNGSKNEYPGSRSEADVSNELKLGRTLLQDKFGEQAIAVFVPPYNVIDDRFLPLLPQSGLNRISRKGPRPDRFASPRLEAINAHVAPIEWTRPPSFGEEDKYLAPIIDHLSGRRERRYDPEEPTGLLTHHLAQNERSFAFITQLVELVTKHPAGVWLDCRRDIHGVSTTS